MAEDTVKVLREIQPLIRDLTGKTVELRRHMKPCMEVFVEPACTAKLIW
jgi:hypothetical protein